MNPKKLELVSDSDEFMATVGENPPLLPPEVKKVEALCRSVKSVLYPQYKYPRWVFKFVVVAPGEWFDGVKLQMFVRHDPGRKNPSVSSKLWKVGRVADPTARKITKGMFKGKMFRCRVRPCGEGGATYTVVDMILERMTE